MPDGRRVSGDAVPGGCVMNRHDEPSRAIADPQPGYFRVRQVKNGPFVAARIWFRFGIWGASINKVACGAEDADPTRADGVFRVWTTGTRITAPEYAELVRSPPTSPGLPINIGSMPAPKF